MPPVAEECSPCVAVLGAVDQRVGLASFAEISRLPLKERSAHWVLIGTSAPPVRGDRDVVFERGDHHRQRRPD